MKNTLALLSGLSVLALAGCSSQQDYQTASGSYDYLDVSQRASVKVPEGLDSPEFSQQYELPNVGDGADNNLIGRSLSVQSPALVLPLVAGSRVEEGSDSAVVVFDQVDDSKPLEDAIWDTVLSFLEEKQIGVESFDKAAGKLVTDWTVERIVSDDSWYDFSDAKTSEVSRRFVFQLDVKAHGRSAALSASLDDYKMKSSSGDAETLASINEMTERREEIGILNEVLGYYEYQIKLDESKRIAQIRSGLNIEMGFDGDGAPAYVVDAQYDIAWPRMLLVLRKMGFDVKDLDKSTGLLFVSYNDEDSGWWSGLFSDDKDLLEKGEYRLKVQAIGENKTSITFMNDESEPFEPNQVADLYDQFARVMTEDNLDI